MNYLNYYHSIFKRIYIHEKALDLKAARFALNFLKDIETTVLKENENIPEEHMNKNTLFITVPKGQSVGRCPGSKGHICCNYLTVDLYSGCTLGCTYCIMKSYLNFSPITVYADPEPALKKLKEIAGKNPETMIRLGTGEIGDSLQFDPLFNITRIFIEELSIYKNVFFEAKTKTDFVDHILDIENKGNAVIGFSLNPDSIAKEEEEFSAKLDERFAAARKAEASGYLLSFHFDPIFISENWESLYYPVIERIGEFPADKIAWISLGTFRYTPELKDKIDDRQYLYDEFIKCRDGKMRYLQKIRTDIYKKMNEKIQNTVKANVYMCMESPAVWENAFGFLPQNHEALKKIFTFPEL